MSWGCMQALDPSKYPFRTLPQILSYATSHYRSAHVLNYFSNGKWHRLSSEAVMEMVRRFALGLRKLGVKEGDAVGLFAQSSPCWLIADLAIQIAGGVAVAIFPRISQTNFEYEVSNSELKTLIVMGQEQWPVYLASEEQFKHVIIHDIDPGVILEEREEIKTFETIMALGDELSDESPSLYCELVDSVQHDHTASIIYTSGSTGCPKGVMLTQHNFVSQVMGALERYPLDPVRDRAFTCLPLAHVFERMVIYYYLAAGVPIYFCDDVKNLRDLLLSCQPTCMTMVPRILEKLHSRLQSRIEQSSYLNRAVGRWALGLASLENPSWTQRQQMKLADRVVFRKLRKALGSRLKYVVVGGAALEARLCRFFRNMGIETYQGYGQTESAPVIAANYENHNKCGTVGLPWPGVEVKISFDGEILARGPNIMRGYHKNPEATAETVDSEGWLHTGDLGLLDDEGYLVVTGRLKEVLKTSSGKMVAPVPIEQRLCHHPLIDMVMLIAEGRNFVSCLVFPDFDVLRQWKTQKKKTHVSHEAFLESPEVRGSIQKQIDRVNASLDKWQTIKKFRFVPHPVSVEGGELTPTLKIRRSAVLHKYSEMIDQMYEENGER